VPGDHPPLKLLDAVKRSAEDKRFFLSEHLLNVGIKIEPKEFFMYVVFLAFSKEHPDPEDEAIKAYLDAHELIP
jgi:hypothetical protein